MNAQLQARIGRIADDTAHGGSWLARQAVETIAEASQQGEDVHEVAEELVKARPAFGAIAGAVGRLLACARTQDQLLEEANALISGRDRAAKAIAVLLQGQIEGTVMTHSASTTVREALHYGRPGKVICTTSEPVGEGRKFAEELEAAGLNVELVTDDDAPRSVRSADLLLLGADTVYADGTLLNKVGTSELADAADAAGVPVLVAGEVIKFVPTDPPDEPEAQTDLTHYELIDLFVTEEGEFTPEDVASLIDRTPFLVEGYELLHSTVS